MLVHGSDKLASMPLSLKLREKKTDLEYPLLYSLILRQDSVKMKENSL